MVDKINLFCSFNMVVMGVEVVYIDMNIVFKLMGKV